MTETNKQQTQTQNHIDYKNISKIKAHLNPHARIHSRKRTGFKVKDQRSFAQAVKRARFMALLPYIKY